MIALSALNLQSFGLQVINTICPLIYELDFPQHAKLKLFGQLQIVGWSNFHLYLHLDRVSARSTYLLDHNLEKAKGASDREVVFTLSRPETKRSPYHTLTKIERSSLSEYSKTWV